MFQIASTRQLFTFTGTKGLSTARLRRALGERGPGESGEEGELRARRKLRDAYERADHGRVDRTSKGDIVVGRITMNSFYCIAFRFLLTRAIVIY